jgi:hypothetical protein
MPNITIKKLISENITYTIDIIVKAQNVLALKELVDKQIGEIQQNDFLYINDRRERLINHNKHLKTKFCISQQIKEHFFSRKSGEKTSKQKDNL